MTNNCDHVTVADCRNIRQFFTLEVCIICGKCTKLYARMVEGEMCHTASMDGQMVWIPNNSGPN